MSEARALWEFRHLVAQLVSRDIKVRYKRSVLGIAWTMLSPLLNMIALVFVFSAVLKQDIPNFPVYLLSGMVFWTFFSQGTSHATSLTTDAIEITRRIYLPRSVFVASAMGVALVNFLLSLVPFLVIILATGHPIRWSWLFLPVAVFAGALFSVGVALVVFTLAMRFADVKETYMVLLTPWFFITPIVYSPKVVPPEYAFLVKFNPMTYIVEMFRAPLYHGWLPGWKTLSFALLGGLISLVLGWLFYTSKIEEYGTRC